MANQVGGGDRYRCPVERCGCEITVDGAPDVQPTREFVNRCGHRMEKVV